jgi:membrane protein YqaA with SNARE-associated domain
MKKLLPFLTGVLWGSFEATWFFIVPDILLCYWALRTARQAFWSTVGVTLGALLGAVFIYWVCSMAEKPNHDLFNLPWTCVSNID